MSQNIKLLVKTLLLITSLIGCAYHTIGILNIYLLHPYNVVVRIETDATLSLPGITLCSEIGVKLSSLARMPGFEEKLKALKAGIWPKKQQLYDQYSLKFRTEEPVETLLNMSIGYSEFLNTSYTKCACDRHLCSTYKEYIATYQQASAKCFTLFHAINDVKVEQCATGFSYAATPERISKASRVGDAEPSEIGLQHQEIIRLQVKLDSKDNVNIDEPPYATMLVHHNDMIPAMQRYRTVRLKPGFYHEISIQTQKTKLLKAPFDTRCQNYPLMTRTDSRLHPILDTPLSQRDCMIQCLATKTMSTCQCWPPELPYASMLETKHESNVTLCDWKTDVSLEGQSTKGGLCSNFTRCFATYTEPCTQLCRNDCVRFRYVASVMDQVWPSAEVIKIAGNQSSWAVLRNCCATVSVRSATGETTVYESVRKYETIEFLSYIGGLISLWLGFSVIGIYDYFNFFYHLADRRRNLKQNGAGLPTPVYLSPRNLAGRQKVMRHRLDISVPKRSDIYGGKFPAGLAPSFSKLRCNRVAVEQCQELNYIFNL